MKKKVLKAKPWKSIQKKSVKKTIARAPFPKAAKPVGKVTHYYGDIGVGIVKFGKSVKAGTTVEFRGATTNFTQTLASMQYDHKAIQTAPKGKEVGIKVKKRVREGDGVFEIK
jgi:putative protease